MAIFGERTAANGLLDGIDTLVCILCSEHQLGANWSTLESEFAPRAYLNGTIARIRNGVI